MVYMNHFMYKYANIPNIIVELVISYTTQNVFSQLVFLSFID